MHSLWIGWTFTLGFFSWVAFLYIGLRTRQRRWILWSMAYLILFVYEVAARASTMFWPRSWDHSWQGSVITILYFVIGALSVFHAFRVRKEYLVRLDNSLRTRRSRMFATTKGKKWEWLHSLWIGWTFALGFFSWLAFLYAGARVRHLRWKLWGLAYAVPPILFLLLLENDVGATNTPRTNFLISVTVGMGVVSIVHALLVRKEYLMRLEIVERETSNVSITSQGKRWEFLQSLWIIGTFTFGLFSWVSFLYIGVRTRRTRWVLWSVFYFAFFLGYTVVVSTIGPESRANLIGVSVLFVVMLGSIAHAFMVRKDYLTRLEARLQEAAEPDAALRRRLEAEYAREAGPNVATEEAPAASAADAADDAAEVSRPPIPDAAPRPVREVTPTTTGARSASVPTLERPESDSISQDYPLPIAYGWSLLTSLWDPRDRYREQLRLAENVLAFLGSTSLALLKGQDALDERFEFKLYWQGGISPGHWRLIIQNATKALARDGQNPIAEHLRRLNVGSEKKGIGADVGALIRAKNDYKHDRGPITEQHLTEASNELQSRLERCIRALSFFKDYPIHLVQDFDVDRFEGNFVLKCLRCVGDGPGFPQEKLVHPQALPRGDLFLDLGDQTWVPLYPFVIASNCPRCLHRETYFIDRWDDRKGIALMKSFERGHTEEDEQVARAMATLAADRPGSTK